MGKIMDAAQVVRGTAFRREDAATPRFGLAELAGRLVELSGEGDSAVLTLAMSLVLDVQSEAEPVAWIGSDQSKIGRASCRERVFVGV